MIFRPIVRLLCPALLAAASLHGAEQNEHPAPVQSGPPGGAAESAENHVPFRIHQTRADGATLSGFRPFYLHVREGDRETSRLFYPFITWQKETDFRYFSFFQLINYRRQTGPDSPAIRNFDVWPVYFSHETGDPHESYHAVFPLGGTIKHRFGKDRINFILFPLYAQVERNGAQTTYAPWPFLRLVRGEGHQGFAVWPLYGQWGREGDYAEKFILWPFIYQSTAHLSEAQPDEKFGVLPFYTRETSPGYRNENYLWPFFGYSDRTQPVKYHERRHPWPLFVQGRGDVRYVNRWAPFYTHSVVKGYDKTWVAWPLYRHAHWEDDGIAQEKNQVLYFFYWSLTQHSTTNPAAAPAHKTHLWPLLTSWNNGAGRRQLQLLSPLEVFFPTNEPVRVLYSPFFALYRYDQRAPGETRHTLLFNLLGWEKSPAKKEFHLGPLFSLQASPEGSRVALGRGLLAWQRQPGPARWKLSLFDFRPKPANKNRIALSP